MNTQTDINWIHQEIDTIQDQHFLNKLQNLLKYNGSNEMESLANYNLDIEKSLESIENGNFCSEEDARAISKKWGRK